MKKNVMMRVASVMLVLVLMTSSVISGTFAKYVTAGTSDDEARVAHWGVEIVGTADLFNDFYYEEDAIYTLSAESVISNNDDKLVAPGTTDSVADIAISGTPEVAARIEHKVSNITFTNWMVDTDGNGTLDTFYCPLQFTINGDVIDGATFIGDEAGLIAAIDEKVAATHDVTPNTNLAGSGVEDLSVSWVWPFSVSNQYDKYDTQLGDAAADGNAAVVVVDITTTVTQIN